MDVVIPIDESHGRGSSWVSGVDGQKGDVGALHKLSVEEAAELLDTDLKNGLSSSSVNARRAIYGRNVLPLRRGMPIWWELFRSFTDLFSLMLQFAALLCFVAYVLEPADIVNLYLAAFLYVVVVVTSLFSFAQKYRSDQTMREFRNFLPPRATVVRDGGRIYVVPAAELVVGDVVRVALGDKIPADIRLIRCSLLRVDKSSLTGESEPFEQGVKSTSDDLLETANLAFFGCLAIDGTAEGIVFATGADTVFGRIVELTVDGGASETPTTLQADMHHFVVTTAVFSFLVGLIFFVGGLINRTRLIHNLVYSIGMFVSNVPEGLIATVTVALTASARRMATRKVLVKRLDAIESLGSSTVICSDKTGTLTRNRMRVTHIFYARQLETIDDNWSAPSGVSGDAQQSCFDSLLFGAANCSTAVFDEFDLRSNPTKSIEERIISGDASEAGILRFAERIKNVEKIRENCKQVACMPFNSSNKFMVTVNHTSSENTSLRIVMKGAPERVFDRCAHIMTESGTIPFNDYEKVGMAKKVDDLANSGERVLAFAELDLSPQDSTRLLHESGDDVPLELVPMERLTLVGLVSLKDPPREGVEHAVQKVRNAGLRVIMVTGDHPGTAESIAKQVGIISMPRGSLEMDGDKYEPCTPSKNGDTSKNAKVQKSLVIRGAEISNFGPTDWDLLLCYEEIVFARTSPEQKLVIVKELQKQGEVVAVTGDGVNDAPALKQAEIGISMGESGSEVSKEASDIVLLDDNFASLVNGVEEGRLIFDNLKKSIAYSLTSNVPQLMPFLAFVILHIPVPLTTILVLSIDLGTDIFPAIALAYERPESDLMERPPRDNRRERLLNPRLLSYAILQLGLIQSIAGFAAYFYTMSDLGLAPSALIGADRRGRFGTLNPDAQRWLYTGYNIGARRASVARWFADDTYLFKEHFSSKPPKGFEQQKEQLFGKLPQQVNTNISSNQFNNMIKVIGNTTRLVPCQAFSCRIGSSIVRNSGECFDATKNLGPVQLDTLLNRNLRTSNATQNGCFTLWTPTQASEALRYAQTAFFASIVVAQAFSVFACKTRVLSLFEHGLNNLAIIGAVFVEFVVALTIIYLPSLRAGFAVRPLQLHHWIPALPFGALILVYDEMRKWLVRKDLHAGKAIDGCRGNGIACWVRKQTLW